MSEMPKVIIVSVIPIEKVAPIASTKPKSKENKLIIHKTSRTRKKPPKVNIGILK